MCNFVYPLAYPVYIYDQIPQQISKQIPNIDLNETFRAESQTFQPIEFSRRNPLEIRCRWRDRHCGGRDVSAPYRQSQAPT